MLKSLLIALQYQAASGELQRVEKVASGSSPFSVPATLAA
jgi:hypothetical protein